MGKNKSWPILMRRCKKLEQQMISNEPSWRSRIQILEDILWFTKQTKKMFCWERGENIKSSFMIHSIWPILFTTHHQLSFPSLRNNGCWMSPQEAYLAQRLTTMGPASPVFWSSLECLCLGNVTSRATMHGMWGRRHNLIFISTDHFQWKLRRTKRTRHSILSFSALTSIKW